MRHADEALPRLLVLSHEVPESRHAGSLLLLRLLKDYPSERLLVVGSRPHADSEILKCRYATLPDAPLARLYRTRWARLGRSIAAFGPGGEISTASIDGLLGGFRPEVALTVMQESQFYRAASRFCSRRRIPLVLWAHDLVELFEPVYAWAAARRRARNSEVYRSAAARFCISPALAERMEGDYGAPARVLYPNRSEELEPRPSETSGVLRRSPHLVVGYAGGVTYGYDAGLRSLLPALKAAGGILRVYSNAPPSFLADGVEYAGFATSPLVTWERIKAECDVVVQAYTWQSSFRELYETHFPSKLTEYLALGMPVVLSGPSYAAGVAWGLAHPQAAVTITDPSQEPMTDVWKRLREEPDFRMRLATEGLRAGREEFDPIRLRQQFLQALRDTVAASAVAGR